MIEFEDSGPIAAEASVRESEVRDRSVTLRQRLGELTYMLEGVFDRDRPRTVRHRLAYQFSPSVEWVELDGLHFKLVLNQGRYQYVKNSLAKLEERRSVAKRALAEHESVDTGSSDCSLDNIESAPQFLERLELGRKHYGLVVNQRPWGHNHFMLITLDHQAQIMTPSDLAAGLALVEHLGEEYEGTFSSPLAGASVLHFHVHYHKGAAAIWGNMISRRLQFTPFYSRYGTTAGRVIGWPADILMIYGSDHQELVSTVGHMVEILKKKGVPYNLGFRCVDCVTSVVLVPRSPVSEKPDGLNHHPDSWGRFSFNEMAGSIVLLTQKGFEATRKSPERISLAISQMSVAHEICEELVDEFVSER